MPVLSMLNLDCEPKDFSEAVISQTCSSTRKDPCFSLPFKQKYFISPFVYILHALGTVS